MLFASHRWIRLWLQGSRTTLGAMRIDMVNSRQSSVGFGSHSRIGPRWKDLYWMRDKLRCSGSLQVCCEICWKFRNWRGSTTTMGFLQQRNCSWDVERLICTSSFGISSVKPLSARLRSCRRWQNSISLGISRTRNKSPLSFLAFLLFFSSSTHSSHKY